MLIENKMLSSKGQENQLILTLGIPERSNSPPEITQTPHPA